jgi:hypothetical protein
MFLSIVTNLVKKQKNKKTKDKFTNHESTLYSYYNSTDIFIMFINIICFIGAMILFEKCYKKKENFDGLEFLAALCYPLFYVIYRFIVKPEEHCIPPPPPPPQ